MPLVDVFIVRCPKGDCSKKGAVISKKLTEQAARDAVAWHLTHSTHHLMAEAEAQQLAAEQVIERWREFWADGSTPYGQEIPEPGQELARPTKRRRQDDSGASSSRSVATEALIRLAGHPRGPADEIVVRRQDLLACQDSLRRAKMAAEAAATVAAKASRAFADEAATIQDCLDVLTSYAES